MNDQLTMVRRLWRVQVMNELQYRGNVALQLVHSVIALGVALAAVQFVFARVNQVNGWTRTELLALVGVFTLVGGLMAMFIRPNLFMLVSDINRGTLDYVLVKPRDTQLLISVRAIDLWKGVDVLLGLGIIGWATTTMTNGPDLLDLLAFVLSTALGVVILYCCMYCLFATAFWFIRMDEAAALVDAVMQTGRWPMSLYPGWLRTCLTLLIPVAPGIGLPADALISRLTPLVLVGQFMFAVAYFVLCRWFLRVAIRHYSGASA
jgi:ABC-2 type transport system permease protein